jgi:hypothetical protein
VQPVREGERERERERERARGGERRRERGGHSPEEACVARLRRAAELLALLLRCGALSGASKWASEESRLGSEAAV